MGSRRLGLDASVASVALSPRRPPLHAACLCVCPCGAWEDPQVLITGRSPSTQEVATPARAECAVDEASWTSGQAVGTGEGRFPVTKVKGRAPMLRVSPMPWAAPVMPQFPYLPRQTELGAEVSARGHFCHLCKGAICPLHWGRVRARGDPGGQGQREAPSCSPRADARYKEGLSGKLMGHSEWGLYTWLLTRDNRVDVLGSLCKLDDLICVNHWGEFLAR